VGRAVICWLGVTRPRRGRNGPGCASRKQVPAIPGIALRVTDYEDALALKRALVGIDAMVLISSDGNARAVMRHRANAIEAILEFTIPRWLCIIAVRRPSSVCASMAASACLRSVTLAMRTARRISGTSSRMRRRASSSVKPWRSWRNTPYIAALVVDFSRAALMKSTSPCGRAHSR
jgi:hypothetical protein